MPRKTILAIAVALTTFLLTAIGVAAQSSQPIRITTTERVPIIITLDEAMLGAANTVTVTMIVTKEVMIEGTEVVSRSVRSQIVLPPDALLTMESAGTPNLSADVEVEDVPAAPQTAVVEESSEAELAVRVNRGANLRSGPGTNYPIVGGAREGDKVEIVAENADGSWYKLSGGQWIAAFLIENAPTYLPVAEAPPVPTPAPQPTTSANEPLSLEQQIADATAAIARDSNDAVAYFERGFAYAQQRNFQAALNDLNRAIELEPQAAVAYYIRGLVYQSLGNCGQAIQDFTQAISLSPGYPDVYEQRALCFLDMENYVQALPDLQTLLELNPNHPQRGEIEALIQQIRQSP